MNWTVGKKYESDFEILATEKNLVRFSATGKNTGITADENGKKWLVAGTLLAANGVKVTQTGSGGSETYSAKPVGVVFETVDVTNGDTPVSLVVEGYLKENIVLDGFATAAKTAIKAALPEIKFV